MPGYYTESYRSRQARAVKAKAKLAKLGIEPRTNKYCELFFRYMRGK